MIAFFVLDKGFMDQVRTVIGTLQNFNLYVITIESYGIITTFTFNFRCYCFHNLKGKSSLKARGYHYEKGSN